MGLMFMHHTCQCLPFLTNELFKGHSGQFFSIAAKLHLIVQFTSCIPFIKLFICCLCLATKLYSMRSDLQLRRTCVFCQLLFSENTNSMLAVLCRCCWALWFCAFLSVALCPQFMSLTFWHPLGFGDFREKKHLNARGFAREFLWSGMLYRPGKRLKRRGKSSSLYSKKNFLLGGCGFLWVEDF